MLHALWRAPIARFAVVGLAMTGLHLTVFQLLLVVWVPEVANAVAFLAVTQVNFAVSYLWTWSSRHPIGAPATNTSVLRRAALFSGSALAGFAVNAVVLSLAHRVGGLPPLHSAVVATAASAITNFVLGSRVVFARRTVPDPDPVPVWPNPAPQDIPAVAGR